MIYIYLPIVMKWKHISRDFWKLIKNKKRKSLIHKNFQTLSCGTPNCVQVYPVCFNYLQHLLQFELIGHSLKRHTPWSVKAQIFHCTIRTKTKPWGPRNCLWISALKFVKCRSGQGYKPISKTLSVPRTTVAWHNLELS